LHFLKKVALYKSHIFVMTPIIQNEKGLNQSLSEEQITASPANKDLSPQNRIEFYHQMQRIRSFEEASVRAYQQSKIGGFCHTYIGQESVAVGSLSVLTPADQVITAYRCHGHALMLGMPMDGCMAELFGRATGTSKGKGGSMHLFDPNRRFWGGHGIVGAQTPLGVGIAFALKYKSIPGACLCYLGDGAVNQGAYHEALNLAALWELPVIFVIENNRYSMGTSQERSSAGHSLAKRAEGYGMAWAQVKGEDLLAVRAHVAHALEYAHTTHKPMILEIHTYRYRGHSLSDPDQTYRTKDEIVRYRQERDCIAIWRKILLDQKIASQEALDAIDEAAHQEATAAVAFADKSPWPEACALYEDVYWECDNPEERTSGGNLFFD
jgi:pyruvate dehydrogenase E1 component alpha subunit